MSKKAKRTPLGWSETSSGTYHLRVEVAGQATRRIVACGARVEKDSTILTNEEMAKAIKGNLSHVCSTCLHSPLLNPPSVKWGREPNGGFIGETYHGDLVIRLFDRDAFAKRPTTTIPTALINAKLTMRQLRKLHEKIGEYLALVEPPQTATVTITSLPPSRHDPKKRDIIRTIKALRDHLGLDLKTAVDRIRGVPLPAVVFTGDIKKAEPLKKDLEAHGIGVKLETQ